MRNKPAYAVGSVDSALLLAIVLREEGPMRVTDAAQRVGVSVSTAHRLLATLVHRDFAVQLPDRRYDAGPQLGQAPSRAPVAPLREAAAPQLRALRDHWHETANLLLLDEDGTGVRFLATEEADQVLRVGDRTGRILPAYAASGGRALLARYDDAAVEAVLERCGLDPDQRVVHRRAIQRARREGHALNQEATETGLTALGVALPTGTAGYPPAAISLSMPSARWSRALLPSLSTALKSAAARIAAG
ncbi:IclR family transcriptional regulator [Streptomyces sp. BH104]|uniref:IclR family transcriptional regulator n=1 Tax=Streptomyces sp. BH104 TaxID=3410407 RepID=UPI003BB7876C